MTVRGGFAWRPASAGAAAYLAGAKLRVGEHVRIDKGLYPLTVVAAIGETRPWGRIYMRPRLVETTAAEAASARATAKATYELRLGDWRADAAQWRRTGGADVAYMKVFEQGRRILHQYCREAVGTGGFQGGSFSCVSMLGPNRYAAAYRAMFAEDVSPYADITHYAPRKVFAHVYGEDGSPLAQDINGTPGFRIDAYAEGWDAAGALLPALYPIAPRQWKPAVLWAWDRHVGAAGPGDAEKLLRRGHPAWTFVHYPLDTRAAHPRTCLPLAWEADDDGYYAFRNAWAGADDFLVQVYGKARFVGGVWRRRNAGTFRILGLGERWAHGPAFRLNHFRWMENVVVLPDDDINRDACGRVIYRKREADGSGVVTFDLGDVYASAATIVRKTRKGDVTVKAPLYERNGHVRRVSAFRSSGISGLRSVAVDYSGLSGAPCLVAVVDRIRGGGRKVWTWQLGGVQMYGGERRSIKPGQIDRGDLEHTKVEGNRFTITKGGAVLSATFAAPSPVKLAAETREIRGDVWFKSNKAAGKGLKMHSNGVFAEPAERDADGFFVVLTIQRGAAPEAVVDGTGLDATVRVGHRKITFDGEKIVLGE